MSDRVTLFEVGPRDGLQNEKAQIDIATRVELINRLAASGLQQIEIGAFVSPKWVPQMAGSADVLQALPDKKDRWVLVPNRQGLDDALAAGARHVAVFTAASESFSQKNTNASIEESLKRIAEVTAAAQTKGVTVRGYVSCALGCPFEGEIAPAAVIRVTEALFRLGCGEVSIGDTIGTGTLQTTRTLFADLARNFDMKKIAAHFHDTYGQALANLTVPLELGVRTIDSSVAGLGGCPYAPGATGNVATEDVVRFCEGQGLATGIDMDTLAATGSWISTRLNRTNASRAGKALCSRSVP